MVQVLSQNSGGKEVWGVDGTPLGTNGSENVYTVFIMIISKRVGMFDKLFDISFLFCR